MYKALLVEDDAICRTAAIVFLKNICEVDFTYDGEIALTMAQEKKYDIIFLDIGLKRNFTGIDVLKKLREMEEYKDTPILAVTAYAMTGDREKFLKDGFDYYISKPYTKAELLRIVTKALNVEVND